MTSGQPQGDIIIDPNCEAVELSDRARQKGQTNTSRTIDPLIEIVSTT